MPAARMTNVIPAARIALIEMDRAMLSRLLTLAKFGAMTTISATSATRTTRMPTRSHQYAKSKPRRGGGAASGRTSASCGLRALLVMEFSVCLCCSTGRVGHNVLFAGGAGV
ncbi:hypothetical protein FQZ97_1096860 [compost metagenome]